MGIATHKMVFIVGLHRSGTTLLAKLLSRHSQASGLENTGVLMNEGQHLQDVIPAPFGVGSRAFKRGFHQTEKSALATPENAQKLWDIWSPYWDLSKEYLVEKSPAFITDTRLLQYYFPNSYFILITRHPAAHALAISKWASNRPLLQFMLNWSICHRHVREDATHLSRFIQLSYEEMCADPEGSLGRLFEFLGMQPEYHFEEDIKSTNDAYFKRWAEMPSTSLRGIERRIIETVFEGSARDWGYSFQDTRRHRV